MSSAIKQIRETQSEIAEIYCEIEDVREEIKKAVNDAKEEAVEVSIMHLTGLREINDINVPTLPDYGPEVDELKADVIDLQYEIAELHTKLAEMAKIMATIVVQANSNGGH